MGHSVTDGFVRSYCGGGDMSLTVLMIVNNQDRSRDFYHHVIGAEIIRDRDPAILSFHNGVIVLTVGGGPTSDKPTVSMAPRPKTVTERSAATCATQTDT
jgi:lactoylglutathione lyase